jgi:hypothetical protein
MSAESKSDSNLTETAGICTLFEGDYHLGLAAFLNSLVRAGFAGTVWAGYRGARPPWLDQLQSLDSRASEFLIAGQARLALLPVTTEIHLTNYKPQFMLDLLAGPARACEYLWYFDPDIYLCSDWSFFSEWRRFGIALCQEIVNNNLPHNSPLRHQWVQIASSVGLRNPQELNHYYNGGLVGVAAAHTDFLRIWKRMIERAGELGYDLKVIMPGTRALPLHASDQDALNIAAMYSQFPLTTLGPQGMGFISGDAKMYHTVAVKPWRASILRNALAGKPPTIGMKYFFTQVNSPIRAYSSSHLRAKLLACSIAAFIGRFYRRT